MQNKYKLVVEKLREYEDREHEIQSMQAASSHAMRISIGEKYSENQKQRTEE